ncbi:efflux RND transporter periplasmic adaptor subunit [Marivirga harenae]|uniref:efflux RND transporter periplasmic adaptor subunit n=1 Tax=Marivirga harenae TaxID=2010992 RepID=UPI0026E0D38A|nr:efflux RND transporter periplasmic adaptor subunit [Marivirga harenae]WKV12993.1 efflux RND transporter periplasmic adaptor subunit [Marivirga harenae]
MNWKKIIGIIIGIAVIVVMAMKLKSNKAISENKIYQYDKEKAIAVKADTISFNYFQLKTSYTGSFKAQKESKISAEIQGKINQYLVEEGDIVKRGQPLIKLDNSLLRLELENVNIQIEDLESDVKRYKSLAESDAIKGIQLEKAKTGLKSAKVKQAIALDKISKTEIKAPFNGIITAKMSEIGSFAAPGMPLIQLTNISTLKFSINVAETVLHLFELGQSHTVIADAYPNLLFTGKITLIGSKANMSNHFPVEFEIENTSDLKIKSGMYGEVSILKTSPNKLISIPASALVGSSSDAQVYLIKNNNAVLQKITVADKIQDKAIISKGLKEGDVIVTEGFINLFDGANVELN